MVTKTKFLFYFLHIHACLSFLCTGPVSGGPKPLGPCAVAADKEGKRLYIAYKDARQVAVVYLSDNRIINTLPVPAPPTGLALSPGGNRLFVTCAAPESTVSVIDTASFKQVDSFPAGHTAMGPSVSPDGKRLYICNRFNDSVSVIDLIQGREIRSIAVTRQPVASSVSPDNSCVVVANHLPLQSSEDMFFAAHATIISTETFEKTDIELPDGSINLRDICIPPDSRHAFVTHGIGNHPLLTMQVNQGWIMTAAVSVIDLKKKKFISNALLDNFFKGAANPWGIACTPDGETICTAHSGTHDISIIQTEPMVKEIRIFGQYVGPMGGENLIKDCRQRIKLNGRGPRDITISGSKLYVAEYFSDTISVVDLGEEKESPPVETIHLGPEPDVSIERRGEMAFHDATLCLDTWLSCASCHTGGRADAMNWDLLNDGAGTFKNTKSLLFAHKTPPSMATGVRKNAETAVRSGFKHILFNFEGFEKHASAVDAYLKSLRPVPSPHLADGTLSNAALRGKKLFASNALGCSRCHPPPLYTDRRMHKVLPKGSYQTVIEPLDTPSLVEIWRTAPYLHKGQYIELKDVFLKGKHGSRYGDVASCSEEEINDLVAFLLSL